MGLKEPSPHSLSSGKVPPLPSVYLLLEHEHVAPRRLTAEFQTPEPVAPLQRVDELGAQLLRVLRPDDLVVVHVEPFGATVDAAAVSGGRSHDRRRRRRDKQQDAPGLRCRSHRRHASRTVQKTRTTVVVAAKTFVARVVKRAPPTSHAIDI